MKNHKLFIAAIFAALSMSQAAQLPAAPTPAPTAKATATGERAFLPEVEKFLAANPGERPKYEPLVKSFTQWAEEMTKKQGCHVVSATMTRGDAETSDLVLKTSILNGSGKAVAKVEVECVLYTPARTIAWSVNTVTIPISGGIEPGEVKQQTAKLGTTEEQWKAAFNALAKEENLRLDCFVTRAYDKDGALIGFFNPTHEDHELLRELEQKINYAGDQLGKSAKHSVRYVSQSMISRFMVGETRPSKP